MGERITSEDRPGANPVTESARQCDDALTGPAPLERMDESEVYRIGEYWYAKTPRGTIGPLATRGEMTAYLALLDVVAAARGDVC